MPYADPERERERQRLKQKRYYEKNRDEIRAAARARYWKHHERILQQTKESARRRRRGEPKRRPGPKPGSHITLEDPKVKADRWMEYFRSMQNA